MRTKREARALGIVDYQSADSFLKKHNADRLTLCYNTTLERRGTDAIAVRLHSTDVVTYCADGSYVLISGGHQTVTTKDRLNRFLPPHIRVYQENFYWYVHTPQGDLSFRSGLILDSKGKEQ